LPQEYKATRYVEHVKNVLERVPALSPGQVAELQAILADRTTNAPAGPLAMNARPAVGSNVAGSGPEKLNSADEEYRHHGRTQWDAMAEAVNGGRYPAAKLALLMFVRYGPWTGAGFSLAYKIIEMVGQHR